MSFTTMFGFLAGLGLFVGSVLLATTDVAVFISFSSLLLVVGGTSVVKLARIFPKEFPWVAQLLARKPAKVVAIAVANKLARIAWAIMNSGKSYRPRLLSVRL